MFIAPPAATFSTTWSKLFTQKYISNVPLSAEGSNGRVDEMFASFWDFTTWLVYLSLMKSIHCCSLFTMSVTLRDHVILCRSIANTKCVSVNNFPRVTEKTILAANDSITVSVFEETLFLVFFSNCIRKSSSDSGI